MVHQPRSLEGAPEASDGGAGYGACAFVPCKHGARAARGSALVHNDTTRSVRYRVRATPSVNAGNAPSNGSATPQAVQRRAERREALRCVPFAKGQGDAHVGGETPQACTEIPEAPIGAPPPRLAEGLKPAGQAGNTTASRGAELCRGRFHMAV